MSHICVDASACFSMWISVNKVLGSSSFGPSFLIDAELLRLEQHRRHLRKREREGEFHWAADSMIFVPGNVSTTYRLEEAAGSG